MSEIGSGIAEVGRVSAILGAILATFVGLIFIALGIFLISQRDNSTGGWILILLGIIEILVSWFWVDLTQHYKLAAELDGTDTLLRLI